MNSFTHYQPTKINFGVNELQKLGAIVKGYGDKCLLITPEPIEVLKPLFERAKNILKDSGINVFHFDKVTPNPLSSVVDEAIEMAVVNKVNVVVALGGGSAIDTAKVVSYYYPYGKIEWDDVFYNRNHNFAKANAINSGKLPLIAISTTSGTGSQCTQAAVITNVKDDMKTTLFNMQFFPEECIVDPKLMETLPYGMSASTAFDAFCHLSESYLNGRLSPMLEILAIDAMKTIIDVLPKLRNENLLEYREKLAFADTVAGISLSNGGANVPHSLGEILTSVTTKINHGNSLAIVFPHFIEEYFHSNEYGSRIVELITFFDSSLKKEEITKEIAKETVLKFLEITNLNLKITDFTKEEENFNKIKELVLSEYCRFTDKDKLITIINKSM